MKPKLLIADFANKLAMGLVLRVVNDESKEVALAYFESRGRRHCSRLGDKWREVSRWNLHLFGMKSIDLDAIVHPEPSWL